MPKQIPSLYNPWRAAFLASPLPGPSDRMLRRYRVDRGKSAKALEAFLEKKDALLTTEKQWLLDIHATAVWSDAAFL